MATFETVKENTLFSDASFDWTKTEKSPERHVEGRICVADSNGLKLVEKVKVGKVEGLKQYINILELTAIGRAVEIAIQKKMTGSLHISSDSSTACAWAFNGKIPNKVMTEAHANALAYFQAMKKQYTGEVFVGFVERDNNLAGRILEELLEEEKGR